MILEKEREGQKWIEREIESKGEREGRRKTGGQKKGGKGGQGEGDRKKCILPSIYSNAGLYNHFNNFPTQEIRSVMITFLAWQYFTWKGEKNAFFQSGHRILREYCLKLYVYARIYVKCNFKNYSVPQPIGRRKEGKRSVERNV